MNQRFLIIQTAFIGDVILASSLIEAISQSEPTAKIDFVLRAGNESLFKNHPKIERLIIWEKRNNKYQNLLKTIKEIRQKNYDKVFNLQRFGASGLMTFMAKSKHKAGFEKNPFSFAFNLKVEHKIGNGKHEVERNLMLLNQPKITKAPRPKLYPSNSDLDAIKPFISEKYICLAPASVWFTKQLPVIKWIEIANKYVNSHKVFLLGAPSDSALCNQIINGVKNNKNLDNLCGKLSLLQSAALMEKAEMNFVG